VRKNRKGKSRTEEKEVRTKGQKRLIGGNLHSLQNDPSKLLILNAARIHGTQRREGAKEEQDLGSMQ